ncbi:D-alanine--D-alanine ligase family protein [Sediminispirochaeta smaragdinae]|jgi:D-alanine-D-alanine ligase|uniref:D-alanine--D-alanine ligase n=1 Tax=Sediminispirochaeta smaragdinae (strain DSM 11293 / JCM 15392 / SEBR 4228) TaxID=573413 RepID=E1R3M7_SEDSS|nr:D-alanine--D-alanine ligase family protein [Sediminispirochaeta smaragdinae]ADK81998.1 D-alanine/D-alanine ligase [Sediminispirochaeta smaragdinae DSM 11293]
MKRIKVALLFGGKSGEHEVSLVSAASVFKHIDKERFDVALIAVDKDGAWFLQPQPLYDEKEGGFVVERKEENRVYAVPAGGLRTMAKPLDIELVFPVLHGTFGEDGTVQGLLELCDLPYAGAGVLGSSLCMDKAAVKRIWIQAGLPVVPFEELREVSWKRSKGAAASVRRAVDRFSFPLFVKPSRAGSSVGVSRCETEEGLYAAIEDAFSFDDKLLIEPAVQAKEIECSVIGNQELTTFAPGEIVPSHDFYDYDAKYIDPDGANLLIPSSLNEEQQKMVRQISARAYRVAEAEGFARVDCFYEEATGKVLLNEINTIPGFTKISMFPKLCENGGVAYGELLTKLLDLAVDRHKIRGAKSYQWS